MWKISIYDRPSHAHARGWGAARTDPLAEHGPGTALAARATAALLSRLSLTLDPVLQPQKSKGTKPGRSHRLAPRPPPPPPPGRPAAAPHQGGGGYGRRRSRLHAGSCSCTASTSGRDSGVRPRPGRRSWERQLPARGHAGDVPVEGDRIRTPSNPSYTSAAGFGKEADRGGRRRGHGREGCAPPCQRQQMRSSRELRLEVAAGAMPGTAFGRAPVRCP
ncbi:hypothetical protein PAHAL_5G436700 [Panicum hallii]|uniref:Uncharacterized protein n=1 Tax=Panicum hallii TaxID=206008 RepID=A0A2S3HWV3_9POAL|nr:hypothetical protein PAHAL_5G436700 [Panicum hallii]